jgi:hypothetical protein
MVHGITQCVKPAEKGGTVLVGHVLWEHFEISMDIVQNAPLDTGKILLPHRLAKLVLKENFRRMLVPSMIRAPIVLKVDLLETPNL